MDLRIPPREGFIGPGLVQFEDLEKQSCKAIVVEHGIGTGPHLLRAECEPRLSMSSSDQVIYHRRDGRLTWMAV